MLQKLLIKNIALIDYAEIPFSNGLNVLSGETGAGKSVILESLNFVLGAKADKTLIRSGQNECSVVAEFNVENNEAIYDVYNELDFEQDDLLIISRKFTIDGKSSIKINGNSVTVSMLKKFTSLLVDVHGQSEHFNLLKTSNQLSLLDSFGGKQIVDIKNTLSIEYTNYKDILSKLDTLGGDESQRLIRLDVLNYQINEITNANLKDGEEENLILIKQKLINQEKIVTALRSIYDCISSDGGVEDILSNARKTLSSISSFDNEYSELYDRLENVFAEVNDIADSSSSILDNFEESEYNLEQVEDRLALIKSLKNKYGDSIVKINEFLDNALAEKNKLENFAELFEKLTIDKSKIEKSLYSIYNDLSDKRREYAKIFEKNIVCELKELGMKNAEFKINFSEKPELNDCKFNSSNGFDNIEFLFSANLGEPLKNLSMVISGGEMSRFMLSIKAQTSKFNNISTFIFDEIDAGISGNIAKVVAEKFAKISRYTQIIAISHLPQISAMADNNLLIEKTEDSTKTTTSVKALSFEQKIDEIIRLVGGDKNSLSAKEHAKELLSNCANTKEKLNSLICQETIN